MHKIFLTKPECELINGAEKIVELFGGFPSMEDGELLDIRVQKCGEHRSTVSLLFDITGWKNNAMYYKKLKDFSETLICFTFNNCRDVFMQSPLGMSGEIKFSNSADRSRMYQDDTPDTVPVIERPYCAFYIRDASCLIIEFFENECTISAEIVKQSDYRY